MSTLIPLAALAACVSPTAPSSPEPAPCLAGKVPYATCANGDFINPLGDFINPLGSVSVTPGQ